jgi:hypothetical protein
MWRSHNPLAKFDSCALLHGRAAALCRGENMKKKINVINGLFNQMSVGN